MKKFFINEFTVVQHNTHVVLRHNTQEIIFTNMRVALDFIIEHDTEKQRDST